MQVKIIKGVPFIELPSHTYEIDGTRVSGPCKMTLERVPEQIVRIDTPSKRIMKRGDAVLTWEEYLKVRVTEVGPHFTYDDESNLAFETREDRRIYEEWVAQWQSGYESYEVPFPQDIEVVYFGESKCCHIKPMRMISGEADPLFTYQRNYISIYRDLAKEYNFEVTEEGGPGRVIKLHTSSDEFVKLNGNYVRYKHNAAKKVLGTYEECEKAYLEDVAFYRQNFQFALAEMQGAPSTLARDLVDVEALRKQLYSIRPNSKSGREAWDRALGIVNKIIKNLTNEMSML